MSVVDLYCLKPACDGERYASILCLMRFRVMMLRILRKMESRTIGRRLDTGPSGLPGFCNRISFPLLISSLVLFLKELFYMSARMGERIGLIGLISSEGMPSGPAALLLFSWLMALTTSSVVIGFWRVVSMF